MKVHEAMSKDVETVRPSETIKETAQRMRARGLGYFPVAYRGRLLGVITDRDITCRAVAEERDPKMTKVRDIMSKGVPIASATRISARPSSSWNRTGSTACRCWTGRSIWSEFSPSAISPSMLRID